MKAFAMLGATLALAAGCGQQSTQDGANKRIADAYKACASTGMTGGLNLGDHGQTISALNLKLSVGDSSSLSPDFQAIDCVLGHLHTSHALITDMFGISQTGSRVENGVRYEWKLQKGTDELTMAFLATTLD